MTTKDSYQLTVWLRPNQEMKMIFPERPEQDQLETRTQHFDRGTHATWIHFELERLRENGIEGWVEENKSQVVLADGYVAERGEAIALFTTSKHVRPVTPEEAT